MTKTLTELIAIVQSLLLDDGTRYTTATVTAAVRAALKDYNTAAPIHAGTLVEVVAGQKEYVLNSSDFDNLLAVFAVLKQGTDEHLEYNVDIPFDAYFEDNAPVIRLRAAEQSGFLIVRYTVPNTVNGLDSATESTIPTYFENVLTDGAAYWSCVIRSLGRVETINLNQGVPKTLSETMNFFYKSFMFGLSQASKRNHPTVSEPSTAAWNDGWHGWNV